MILIKKRLILNTIFISIIASICIIAFIINYSQIVKLFSEISTNTDNSISTEDISSTNLNKTFAHSNLSLVSYEAGVTTEVIIVVAFINYANDTTNYLSQAEIDNIMLYFNDEDLTNNILSVYEYYQNQTQGKLSVKAVSTTYTTSNSYNYYATHDISSDNDRYYIEENLWASAIYDKTFTLEDEDVTTFHCRLNYFAGNVYINNETHGTTDFLWPHAWLSNGLMLLCENIADSSLSTTGPYNGIMIHELGHIMGLYDLYVSSGVTQKPIGTWDIMSDTNYIAPQSMNTYYREIIGGLSESHYYDNETTGIENVTSSGTYTLYSTTSETGTVGLKFGIKNGDTTEYFMVEYKIKTSDLGTIDQNLPSSGVLIYRIDETVDGNLGNNNEYEVYLFRDNNENTTTNAGLSLNESFGSTLSNANNLITYANGTNSQIVVKFSSIVSGTNAVNVQITLPESEYSSSGRILRDGNAVAGVAILVDGEDSNIVTDSNGFFFITELDLNAVLTFSKSGIEILNSIVITGDLANQTVNIESGVDANIVVYSVGLVPVADATVKINGITRGVTNSEGIFSVTSILINDVITIEKTYYTFESVIYTSLSGTTILINGYQISDGNNNNYIYLYLENILTSANIVAGTDNTFRYSINGGTEIALPSPLNGSPLIKIAVASGNFVEITSQFYYFESFEVISGTYEYTVEGQRQYVLSLTFLDENGATLDDVSAYLNSEYVDSSTLGGRIEIDKVLVNNIYTFTLAGYDIESYTFTSYENIQDTITCYYKTTVAYVQFINYLGEDISLLVQRIDLDGVETAFSTADSKIVISVKISETLTFSVTDYYIADLEITAFSSDYTFDVLAKKYVDISGTISFPEDSKIQEIDVYVNNQKITTSDLQGVFILEDIFEGDVISFISEDYEIDNYTATITTSNLSVEATAITENGNLVLYIIVGIIFIIMFVVPLFVRAKPKKKYLEKI